MTALADLTVAIEPGVVGLVGVNGAGKSTLIKLALGLLAPTGGKIRVLGLDPIAEGEAVRGRVGYMPEHDCLPPDVIAAEFVTHMARVSGLPAAMARERASETLRHVGLYEERYRRIGGYSTGMKQRVKLAQALVHDPELLLLDEPTNGLDPEGRRAGGPCSTWSTGSAPSSASRSWCARTCSARSSGSARRWSRSTPAGCCARRRCRR
ncbi:ABC transporter ATP-binding protein [Actinophytocola sp.]|uniref:ABC transporter ATP-binding protein n=1 Tax=Actinophytocola sp. TaxID=1872138 RepID=UPI0025BF8F47|nr:ABC transporter ATP-binding protein [Actinophytocola sp.]